LQITIAEHSPHAAAAFELQPPLGQILLARGVITEADVAKALSFQSSFGGIFGAILIRIGAVAEDAVLEALATQLDMGIMSNETLPQDPAVYVAAIKASGIDSEWWVDQSALAWQDDQGHIHCFVPACRKRCFRPSPEKRFTGGWCAVATSIS
jgi:hypothetical protein